MSPSEITRTFLLQNTCVNQVNMVKTVGSIFVLQTQDKKSTFSDNGRCRFFYLGVGRIIVIKKVLTSMLDYMRAKNHARRNGI